jgi:hypothetical protein
MAFERRARIRGCEPVAIDRVIEVHAAGDLRRLPSRRRREAKRPEIAEWAEAFSK